MLSELIVYQSNGDAYARIIDDGQEIYITHDLTHYASDLLQHYLHSEEELEEAVQRAITICAAAGLSPAAHFRTVFHYTHHILQRDWLVSDMGLQLIILNADPSNPVVARLQIELLTRREK